MCSSQLSVPPQVFIYVKEDGDFVVPPTSGDDVSVSASSGEVLDDASVAILLQEEEWKPDEESRPKRTAGTTFSPSRRRGKSGRRGKRRANAGCRRLKVFSDMTVQELKIDLCQSLGIAPLDQHLLHDVHGELGPCDATLGRLRVEPGAILRLKTDRPSDTFDVSGVAIFPARTWRGAEAPVPMFICRGFPSLPRYFPQDSPTQYTVEKGFSGTSLVFSGETWPQRSALSGWRCIRLALSEATCLLLVLLPPCTWFPCAPRCRSQARPRWSLKKTVVSSLQAPNPTRAPTSWRPPR